MQTINLNEITSIKSKTTKRKDVMKTKRKTRRKEKFVKFFNFVKKIFCGTGSVYVILALVSYILISQIKLNNALTNIQKDTHIPGYVIDKLIDYLN